MTAQETFHTQEDRELTPQEIRLVDRYDFSADMQERLEWVMQDILDNPINATEFGVRGALEELLSLSEIQHIEGNRDQLSEEEEAHELAYGKLYVSIAESAGLKHKNLPMEITGLIPYLDVRHEVSEILMKEIGKKFNSLSSKLRRDDQLHVVRPERQTREAEAPVVPPSHPKKKRGSRQVA